MKKLILFILLLIVMPFVNSATSAIVYKNEACGHCEIYLEELKTFLKEKGINLEEKDLINNNIIRNELNNLNKEFEIPIELQGHMVVKIGNLILEGHVPVDMVDKYLGEGSDEKVIIYQDYMAEKEDLKSYKVMDKNGIRECEITKEIKDCLNEKPKSDIFQKSLLLLILFNGIIAGIHPCTISVLLFFIAFLFTIRKTRANILKVGASYIIGIFLAYFLIGLGVFKVFALGNHFSAKIGIVLITILGLYNIYSFFTGDKRFNLGIPKSFKGKVVELVHRASLPAAFIIGLIVGICSFGCTAGIYFSILSLLLIKATYLQGFGYLILYNIMFILPLILILIFASSKRVVEKMEKWEGMEKKYVKLIAGIVMIIIAILIWLMLH